MKVLKTLHYIVDMMLICYSQLDLLLLRVICHPKLANDIYSLYCEMFFCIYLPLLFICSDHKRLVEAILAIPSRELTYPTFGKGRIIFKSANLKGNM